MWNKRITALFFLRSVIESDRLLCRFSRENRLQNESRRVGRLNLAQDVVLGRISRDEKSRRDDWQLPGRDPQSNSIQNILRLRIPEPITFSLVPTGLFKGAC